MVPVAAVGGPEAAAITEEAAPVETAVAELHPVAAAAKAAVVPDGPRPRRRTRGRR